MDILGPTPLMARRLAFETSKSFSAEAAPPTSLRRLTEVTGDVTVVQVSKSDGQFDEVACLGGVEAHFADKGVNLLGRRCKQAVEREPAWQAVAKVHGCLMSDRILRLRAEHERDEDGEAIVLQERAPRCQRRALQALETSNRTTFSLTGSSSLSLPPCSQPIKSTGATICDTQARVSLSRLSKPSSFRPTVLRCTSIAAYCSLHLLGSGWAFANFSWNGLGLRGVVAFFAAFAGFFTSSSSSSFSRAELPTAGEEAVERVTRARFTGVTAAGDGFVSIAEGGS